MSTFPLVALFIGAWLSASYDLATVLVGWGAVMGTAALLGITLVYDKITFEPNRTGGDTYVSLIKYSNPASFKEYAVIFDPTVVGFDAYSIQVSYKKWTNPNIPFGRQTTGVEILSSDPSKRKLHILANYTKPANSNNKYINDIIVQFFYIKRPDPTAHASMLAKFNAIRTDCGFVVYDMKGGSKQVAKTGLSWNIQPAIHSY